MTTNFTDLLTPIEAQWLNDADAHIFDQTAGAHDADHISIDAIAGMAATDVQGALEQLKSDIVAASGGVASVNGMTGAVTLGAASFPDIYSKLEADALFLTTATGDARYMTLTGGFQSITAGPKRFHSTGALTVSGTNATLECFSADAANASYMSFHKANTYAVNMGLDTDNWFKIGGWSAGAGEARFKHNPTSGETRIDGWLYVGDGENFSYIGMTDVDEGLRYIHCNTNRIGFLKQDGTWGSYCNDDGSWTSVGEITAFSDAKLKENVEVIDNALDKVKQIRGVTYDRIDMDGKRQAGVIAQEVEKVLPEVVSEQVNDTKAVAYGNMVGLLIEAIKEQSAQIDRQAIQIAELQTEVARLIKE